MSGSGYHVPVLLNEVLELFVAGAGVYVDGTLGGGGHFRAIAAAIAGEGGPPVREAPSDIAELSKRTVLIGIDRDREALDNARRAGFDGIGAEVVLEQARFSEFDSVLRKHDIEKVHGLFVDLGVSSRQIDVPERGFRYMEDSPLDMRMDQCGGITAARFLEECGENELARVLKEYGEIRNSQRMAGAIKGYMKHEKILTSAGLKACIAREYGPRVDIQALAKLFQALRIAVNGELDELRTFLDKSVKYLAEGGRLAVISYHSLEDRMVKEFFRKAEEACVCPPRQPVCVCGKQVLLRRVNRKAVTASDSEISRNPRARSARLRVAVRTGVCL
ncbi:MAG: 16S rRNA (cytosine(1402)-N(4))-methyltransferase RsmH [Chitinispirillia bacterium]|nr:16S rRNA (cytosine(1402)-N(4))-methyltransferase RsmH [Chitinispirillia bacterium]MCL2267808.1 16S rRNA (cytosine(1402)-N(4))-methyltransferase RsmH [Chitinispirillia bacterium]